MVGQLSRNVFNNSRRFMATVSNEAFAPKKYGGRYTVTLIPGDGIGEEISKSVVDIFKAENVPIDWETINVSGLDDASSQIAVKDAVQSLKRNKVGLKGIWYTPTSSSGHGSLNVALVKQLDIYASLAHIKNIPGIKTRLDNIDIILIRESTEAEYSGLEHQSVPGVVESLKIVTKYKSERIAKFAFDYASKNNRKNVTAIHKANIMKLADGLFRQTVKEVGQGYENINVNDMIVDNASMQAVSRPEQFDVLVTPNLYGSILSNIATGLVGGPGLVPGANYGAEHAVFEPGCRHVGLSIKGQNIANPTALILSSTMMLNHLGLSEYADRISNATYEVIKDGKVLTHDIGGNATTEQFTKAILEKLKSY
ncbi:isocitrate dehydrogenase subunit 1 mitochondrial precursor [Ascoidea rubescens DSM 1968]|uniref:Isocitrate dehydrogenase [NAD] subunit 1, mitochondrial n=1 Tax=Ascoidea rubescens DSM 1968 TaxID=1344418 RepID=A0A1D2VA47_9ASCO|nr:isocitrate dehydrogenase subunit 1 mitochondrial precursor [Ascoidea rubescens DSM 1968]ODV58524.1 isocitrate dehydrogenase subunit 1 mitochondrial precursor [Ascoidea rubescens DSM 1968]